MAFDAAAVRHWYREHTPASLAAATTPCVAACGYERPVGHIVPTDAAECATCRILADGGFVCGRSARSSPPTTVQEQPRTRKDSR